MDDLVVGKAVALDSNPPDVEYHEGYAVNMKAFREAHARNQEMIILELAVCEAALKSFAIGHQEDDLEAFMYAYKHLEDAVEALSKARENQKCPQA